MKVVQAERAKLNVKESKEKVRNIKGYCFLRQIYPILFVCTIVLGWFYVHWPL